VMWLEWYAPRGRGPDPYDAADLCAALKRLDVAGCASGPEARTTEVRLGALQEVGREPPENGREPKWAQPGIHADVGIITAAALVLASAERRDAVDVFHALRTVRLSFVVLPACLVTIRWRPQMHLLRNRRGEEGLDRLRRLPDDPAYLFAGRGEFRAEVERQWIDRAGVACASGDLALLVIKQLTASFPGVIRDLAVMIDELEEEHLRVFYDRPPPRRARRPNAQAPPPVTSPDELKRHWIELGHTLSALHRQIAPLRRYDGPLYLIKDTQALDYLKERYDEALDEVRGLRQDYRASMDSIAGVTLGDELESARKQEAEAQRTRSLLDKLAAFVLVPTLVAGVFGANVDFPGNGSAAGFIALVAIMALSGLVTFLGLRSAERRRRTLRLTLRSRPPARSRGETNRTPHISSP